MAQACNMATLKDVATVVALSAMNPSQPRAVLGQHTAVMGQQTAVMGERTAFTAPLPYQPAPKPAALPPLPESVFRGGGGGGVALKAVETRGRWLGFSLTGNLTNYT